MKAPFDERAEPAEQVGPWRIEARLEGGAVEAHLVRRSDGVRGRLIRLPAARAGDSEAQAALLHEAEVAALFSHPGLVRTIDRGVAESRAYVVSEPLDGVTLETVLRAESRAYAVSEPLDAVTLSDAKRTTAAPSEPRAESSSDPRSEARPESRSEPRSEARSADFALELGRRLAEALAYVHQLAGPDGRQLMLGHGGVSPANVHLMPDGRVLLDGFRIPASAALHPEAGHFSAPELRPGARVTSRSDLFGLGVMLAEQVGGVSIRSAPNPRRVREVCTGRAPELFVGLLAELTDPDPNRRPPVAMGVAHRLRLLGAQSTRGEDFEAQVRRMAAEVRAGPTSAERQRSPTVPSALADGLALPTAPSPTQAPWRLDDDDRTTPASLPADAIAPVGMRPPWAEDDAPASDEGLEQTPRPDAFGGQPGWGSARPEHARLDAPRGETTGRDHDAPTSAPPSAPPQNVASWPADEPVALPTDALLAYEDLLPAGFGGDASRSSSPPRAATDALRPYADRLPAGFGKDAPHDSRAPRSGDDADRPAGTARLVAPPVVPSSVGGLGGVPGSSHGVPSGPGAPPRGLSLLDPRGDATGVAPRLRLPAPDDRSVPKPNVPAPKPLMPLGAGPLVVGTQPKAFKTPAVGMPLALGALVIGLCIVGVFTVTRFLVGDGSEGPVTTSARPRPPPPAGLGAPKIAITSSPSGAQIRIDGAATDHTTPATLEELVRGRSYSITVTLAEHETPPPMSLSVTDEMTQSSLHFPLSRIASIRMVSTPPGAKVTVEGRATELSTPLDLSVLEGRPVEVRVSSPGYFPQTLSIDAGTKSPVEVTLKPAGTLTVRSRPANASVYVDGELQGKTPLEEVFVEANRNVELRIERPDKRPWQQKLRLSPRDRQRIDAKLVDRPLSELPLTSDERADLKRIMAARSEAQGRLHQARKESKAAQAKVASFRGASELSIRELAAANERAEAAEERASARQGEVDSANARLADFRDQLAARLELEAAQ